MRAEVRRVLNRSLLIRCFWSFGLQNAQLFAPRIQCFSPPGLGAACSSEPSFYLRMPYQTKDRTRSRLNMLERGSSENCCVFSVWLFQRNLYRKANKQERLMVTTLLGSVPQESGRNFKRYSILVKAISIRFSFFNFSNSSLFKFPIVWSFKVFSNGIWSSKSLSIIQYSFVFVLAIIHFSLNP